MGRFDPKGKVVLITGASRGIGRETALAFARTGARVVVSARTEAEIEKVAEEIRAGGGEAIAIRADVSKREEVESLVGGAIARMGGIDVLVNNAGYLLFGEAKDLAVDDWEALFRVNVWGVVYATYAVLPHLLEKGSGQIINVSSIAGKATLPGFSAYCASKFAVAGMTTGMQSELHRKGIDVILICPSLTGSDFWRRGTYRGLDKIGGEQLMQSPASVAKAIVDASRKRKREVVLTATGKMSVAFYQRMPRTTGFVMAQFARTYDWLKPKSE